ncbi:MAG TPA: aminotransferase class III-fold pyridoxal phosphate-dependent enzyme [Dehalococcoidia bacterium]|nr:aminotransferase class III-fold pyridoxal phosphate-dependent enzyme [Dehalococcoidia bacterium]
MAINTVNIIDEYIKTHPGSKKLHERALKIFSANGATHTARVLDPFRPYVVRAQGTRKWDIDGNEYLDYVMGHGALILGHAHPAVVQAVQEQVAKGTHYGENHPFEVEWAELIQRNMPAMKRIEFFPCGQEANMMAIRLSRLFTGRKKILRFAENFHGWGDELVVTHTPGVSNDYVTMIPGHDLKLVEKELATKEYALVMAEGGGAHMAGQVPWDPDFIRGIPPLAKKYGTIFLIDEVVTGFRDAPGGWQSTIGVTPDLTSLGKIIGGGVGVGALGGRADVMDMLTPKAPPQPFARHSGTWNANPLTAAAGVAACKLYLDGEPQRLANELGAYLREKGNQALKEKGYSCRLYGRTIVHLYLGSLDYEPTEGSLPPTSDAAKLMSKVDEKMRLCVHLLQRGIATMGARFFVLSAYHTKEELDRTVDALISSLDAMAQEGSLGK